MYIRDEGSGDNIEVNSIAAHQHPCINRVTTIWILLHETVFDSIVRRKPLCCDLHRCESAMNLLTRLMPAIRELL